MKQRKVCSKTPITTCRSRLDDASHDPVSINNDFSETAVQANCSQDVSVGCYNFIASPSSSSYGNSPPSNYGDVTHSSFTWKFMTSLSSRSQESFVVDLTGRPLDTHTSSRKRQFLAGIVNGFTHTNSNFSKVSLSLH